MVLCLWLRCIAVCALAFEGHVFIAAEIVGDDVNESRKTCSQIEIVVNLLEQVECAD